MTEIPASIVEANTLRADLAQARRQHDTFRAESEKVRAAMLAEAREIAAQRDEAWAEVERLRAALSFYGHRDNWRVTVSAGNEAFTATDLDVGAMARAALASAPTQPEVCEWCGDPVANGRTHGDEQCFRRVCPECNGTIPAGVAKCCAPPQPKPEPQTGGSDAEIAGRLCPTCRDNGRPAGYDCSDCGALAAALTAAYTRGLRGACPYCKSALVACRKCGDCDWLNCPQPNCGYSQKGGSDAR